MTDQRAIKNLMIAILCEHPDVEQYRNKAPSVDRLDLLQDLRITKQDLFTPDDQGRMVIDTPGFFKNYRQICALLAQNGEKLTLDDFMRPLRTNDRNHHLVFLATQNKAVGDIFAVDLWYGRFEEMQALWHKFPLPHRREIGGNDGMVNLEVKRQLYAREQKMSPEERLKAAGLTTRDILTMFDQKGLYETVVARLTQSGDYLRKEYLLLVDNQGNTVFQRASAWEKYADIVAHLAQHGERLDYADLTRQVGYGNTILGRAAENRALHHIFAPAQWEGKLPEMLQLWGGVLEGWKMPPMTTVAFDVAFAKAQDLTYAGAIDPMRIQSKKDIFTPLSNDPPPVLPVGLTAFWECFPAVQQKLKNLGQPLTLHDLRVQSGLQNETVMLTAVKLGHFSELLSIAKQSNQPLTVDDYMTKDCHGQTMINVLAERQELAKVFHPDLWVGQLSEMKRLWSYVRIADRDQVSIKQLEIAVKQATLNCPKPGRPKLGF